MVVLRKTAVALKMNYSNYRIGDGSLWLSKF
jgi:hypothetical protein